MKAFLFAESCYGMPVVGREFDSPAGSNQNKYDAKNR